MSDTSIELVESREANALLRERLAKCQRIAAKYITTSFLTGNRGAIGAAKAMATALDDVGMNLDQDVDELLAADGHSYDHVTIPLGLDRRDFTWTDYSRKSWDLSVVWVDKGGEAWAWTGCMANDQPVMRRVGAGSDTDAIFEAIQVFDGPLTAGGPRPPGSRF